MLILAVESSCDETAVALVRDGREVLTDQIFSQAALHAVYGGVVPEIASRSHVEVISQLADRALAEAGVTRQDIDAVAVTCAPGLIGALLVGVNFAKSAALALGVPLIPVHHIRGHIAANYIAYPELEPPFVCLAISGGNTLICDVRDYTDMRILGATRDDAAGECFDKTARVLGLPYPGGKPIDDLAKGGDDQKYALPIGHVDGHPYDMSFSGLKTAVINLAHNAEQKNEPLDRASLAASFCRAVSEKYYRITAFFMFELTSNTVYIIVIFYDRVPEILKIRFRKAARVILGKPYDSYLYIQAAAGFIICRFVKDHIILCKVDLLSILEKIAAYYRYFIFMELTIFGIIPHG